MQSDSEALYVGREQTQVKHFILEKYLERFAIIVGSAYDTITYVDCFAGPWQEASKELIDTSFSRAIKALKSAQEVHRIRGRKINLRCFFIEEGRNAYAQLKHFSDKQAGVEVHTFNGKLEKAIGEIVRFVENGGRSNFPFLFVDPTGWTGFGMNTIKPLLELKPSEFLINFMSSHIRRFINFKESKESFEELFGEPDVPSKVAHLEGYDRDDQMLEIYCKNVAMAGKFPFARPAIILEPNENRPHFHLIYCTRDDKGIEVFKDAEKSAMSKMERLRADAFKNMREQGGQQYMFGSDEVNSSTHYDALRNRYNQRAWRSIEEMLRLRGRVPYDEIWYETMKFPLTWETDLHRWISRMAKEGRIAIEGLAPPKRVPKRGNNVFVFLNAETD